MAGACQCRQDSHRRPGRGSPGERAGNERIISEGSIKSRRGDHKLGQVFAHKSGKPDVVVFYRKYSWQMLQLNLAIWI